jgi:hypothetical protein
MKTIKFYTDSNIYKGWLSNKYPKRDYLHLRSWLLSGNYIVFNNMILNRVNDIQLYIYN